MDIERKYKQSPKESGYKEISQRVSSEIVTRPEDLSGRNVLLSDGSTSMANLRGIEIVTTLISANTVGRYASSVRVNVAIGGWGAFAYRDLGLGEEDVEVIPDRLAVLQAFHPNLKIDEKVRQYLPPSVFYVPSQEMGLLETLVATRQRIISDGGSALGIPTHNVRVDVFELQSGIVDKPLSEVIRGSNDPNKTTAKYICLDCSRQQEAAVEHGVVASGESIKTNGGRHMNCKPAREIRKKLSHGEFDELTVFKAAQLGFYFSGNTIYGLGMAELSPESDALLVRNYSNSRGTLANISQDWDGPLGITRRYYFEGKEEITGVALPEVLNQSEALQQRILSESLLVSSEEEDVFLPWK